MTQPPEGSVSAEGAVSGREPDFDNVGQLLTHASRHWPDHPAVAEPRGNGWRQISFSELERDTNRIAGGLRESGVRPGQRLAMLVPPGIDFVCLVFALMKSGAVVILIDPGIGRKNLVRCMADARPEGVVGIARAQLARWLFRKRLPEARNNFIVGRRHWPGCRSIHAFRQRTSEDFEYPCQDAGDAGAAAAIIFTSGSTGPPKGVSYTHGNFITQAMEIRDHFAIPPGGADISGFPLFALFNSAMGVTTVFPKMDFTRPADVSPERFVAAAADWQADQSFGSPALWNTVGRWCEQNRQTLPTIKRAFSAGAPVPAHVLRRVKKIIAPTGEMYTPYGATEALPVACNSASAILGETSEKTDRGAGVCVGHRFSRIDWQVIAITDDPLATIDEVRPLETGEIGELIVRGPVVTRQYLTRVDANALAKISDGETCWHRMGDVGYLDDDQRFWFCGRKSQRVVTEAGTLYTVPGESIINTHPAIYRSALVGVDTAKGRQPVMVAEPWPDHWPARPGRRRRLVAELLDLAAGNEKTRGITRIMLMKKLPVDIRHNSKIFREQVAVAAARRFGPDSA